MDMRELIVLWASILAVLLTMAFPPYGYDHYTYTVFSVNPAKKTVEIKTVPFKYLGHYFIFSEPPSAPPEEKDMWFSSFLKISGFDVSREYYMRIAWHILAAQLVVIVTLATGVLITLRQRRKRAIPTSEGGN